MLAVNRARAIDLFREWDEDGNGSIDQREFRQGVAALGLRAPREAVDALFSEFDIDGGGTIEFNELNKILRAAAAPPPKRATSARPSSHTPTTSWMPREGGMEARYVIRSSHVSLALAYSYCPWCHPVLPTALGAILSCLLPLVPSFPAYFPWRQRASLHWPHMAGMESSLRRARHASLRAPPRADQQSTSKCE